MPLSVIMELGTPNWWIMSVKYNTACLALILVMGWTPIHLENLLIATSKWVKPRAPSAEARQGQGPRQ